MASVSDSPAIGRFVVRQHPVTIVFGDGEQERLVEHLDTALDPHRVVIVHGVSGAGIAQRLAIELGQRCVGAFGEVAQHVPAELAARAISRVTAADADTVVAIGGGSAIGLAKVIALRTGAVIAAVPTTYAGSEMTPVWGLTESARKSTGQDTRVMPRLVVYDAALTLTLSPRTSAASGFNALAHAVDGMYAGHTSPLIRTIALEAIERLAAALPAVVRDPADLGAREQALYGAHLAATVLGTAGMALHHRICHVLGGMYSLPHAETHAVVLPYAVAYNEASAASVNARIARALGGTDAAGMLWQLARRLQLPASLAELGMQADDLGGVAEAAAATPVANPATVTRAGIERVLRAAHAGKQPAGLARGTISPRPR